MTAAPLAIALALATAQPQDPPATPAGAVRVHTPGDPLEGFNRTMFRVFEALDKAIVRPVAMGYKTIVPRFVRAGIRNAIRNLGEPVVFLNDVIQLRPKRAIRTFGRFAINTTLGVGGLIDVARGEHLPHRSNGFGSSLAYYGVGPGPYVFLPVVGPNSLRDLFGGAGDGLVLPTIVGAPFDRSYYQIPRTVLGGLDQRVESDDELRALYAGALDPYASLRSSYLQNRAAQIRSLKAKGRDEGDAVNVPTDLTLDPGSDAATPADERTPELSGPLADPAAAKPADPSDDPAFATPPPAAPPAATATPELDDPLVDPAAAPGVMPPRR